MFDRYDLLIDGFSDGKGNHHPNISRNQPYGSLNSFKIGGSRSVAQLDLVKFSMTGSVKKNVIAMKNTCLRDPVRDS